MSPQPFSSCAGSCLTFGDILAPDTLPIFFKSATFQPVDPFEVKYSLYWYSPSCPTSPTLIGEGMQTPVRGMVGYYYVSGVAGQCGGPGCWFVRWYYREFDGGPLSSIDYAFKVAPPVSACSSACSCT